MAQEEENFTSRAKKIWFIFPALIAFLTLRLYFLGRTMTHLDDIGVPITLLKALDAHLNVIGQMKSMGYWTYAPLQFALTGFFLHFANGYESILIWSRMSSLLLSLVGFVGLIYVFLEAMTEKKHGLPYFMLPSLLLAVFSWRAIIESSQAYNYASTFPCAAFILWTFVTETGSSIVTGKRGFLGSFFLGFALGPCIWLTYQSLPLVFSGFVCLGCIALWKKQFRQLVGLLVTGMGFLIPLVGAYRFHMNTVIGRGYPSLRGFPEDYKIGKLGFVFVSWFEVFQNEFSINPWGYGTAVLGMVFLVCILGALWKRKKDKSALEPVELRILLLIPIIMTVWTTGSLLHKFPLGPTRHSYILQAPFLLLITFALSWWNLSFKKVLGIGIALTIIFSLYLGTLIGSIQNNINPNMIRDLFRNYPDAAFVNPHGAATFDHYLIAREFPNHTGPVVDGESEASFARILTMPRLTTMVLLSHRERLPENEKLKLQRAGWNLQTLAEKEPIGSTELYGNLNGGNGFFLYLASKHRTPTSN